MRVERLPGIARGAFRAYFLYDVADTIDLRRLRTVRGAGVARAPLQLRREASSEFIQYPVAPLVVRLPDLETPRATMRAKLFDFGVVSIRVSLPLEGTWDEVARATRGFRRNADLERQARAALDDVLNEIAGALDEPHPPIVEDYSVVEVEQFSAPLPAARLLGEEGADALAALLLSEDRPVSDAEAREALRYASSYYPDDLVVVQWDAAFVYDRPDAAEAVQDILELANAQLLEFRTYDARLDEELDAIYALEPGRPLRRFLRRERGERAARVRWLLVDVLELTDRASNALKIIGDAYYARLYRAIAARLGLADWQRQIDAKLRSVAEVYRVLQDQAQFARSEALEIVVIVLIAVELVVGLLALRR